MTQPDQESLLVHLRPLLHHSARRALYVGEQRHTEDLAQEMWIAVWKALPDLPPLCTAFDDVVAWCMGVARNRGRNWVRDALLATTHGESNSYLPVVDLLEILLEVPQALDQVEQAYHDGRIAEAVANLPQSYRGYVVQRFWQGVTTTELQRTLSPSTWTRVKKRLSVELKELAREPVHR